MKHKSFFFFAVMLVTMCSYDGCTKKDENPVLIKTPNSSDSILLIPSGDMGLDDNRFQVGVDSQSALHDGLWNVKSDSLLPFTRIFSVAGLWIGMQQDGVIRANIVQDGFGPTWGNYIAKWNGKQSGVFSANASTAYLIKNWPSDLGAPTTVSGLPHVYGDKMLWSVVTSDTTITSSTLHKNPIHGLCVKQSLYKYNGTDVQDIFFIRYEITNMTATPWDNVYIGFYSDTDLGEYYWKNKTAFDSSRSLCYTYVDTVQGFNKVTGFTFLELPKNVKTRVYRYMRRDISKLDDDYNEKTFTTPTNVFNALRGLSNSGSPMINPITGQQTTLAFTGNPVAKTGWLDIPTDDRNLIASAPFSINSGETVTVTIMWAVNDGTDLADALAKLKANIDQMRANKNLWQF